MPPESAVLIETSCTYSNTLLPLWREFACTHTTCPVLQHCSPASRMAWPLEALVLKPRLKLGWQTCDGGLVNKPPFWEKYKNTAYLFCKAFGGSHNLSLKLVTSWNKGKQDMLQPAAVAIASFCSHPTENMWQVGKQRCHQLPALQMWHQHQWTSTGHLYGLPWSPMAHLGFGMSKRPAKSLLKKAFFFLCPFREPIQATHRLDQKTK